MNRREFIEKTGALSMLAALAGCASRKFGAGADGGMDFLMFLRMAYCLRRGLSLDQDVYDLATWSSLVELSEKSVLTGLPMEVPDFTRGAWKTRPSFDIGGVDDAWRKDFESVSAHVRQMTAEGKKLRG